MAKQSEHLTKVRKYVSDIVSGKKIAGKEVLLACIRFNIDLKNPEYDFRIKDAEFVIRVIEETFMHEQGEALNGEPLKSKPFLLEPWEMFIIFNLMGFFFKGTNERRYKEAFIFIPRKNGKTSFIAALAWALALLERRSGSVILIVGAALKQARKSFDLILYNLRELGEIENFRVQDNNNEHSISCRFYDDSGAEVGSIKIEVLAANPDAYDSFNCNIAIADEIHAYKKEKQYTKIRDAMQAYTNKLMIGITTAGDNMNSFCYRRLEYCRKVVALTVKDEYTFCFISRADQDENGDVDYTSAEQHEKANPNYGITIRPADIMNKSLQAQNDPQLRKEFLSDSLNIYTSVVRAYFNLDEFKNSDAKYKWTIDDLLKLPIKWYGGSDLSKLHDLTAAALYGHYKGVDIIISHAWFPITAAYKKAEEDGIPLFGWRDDGWLDMCNAPTVNHADIINWYIKMRKLGFKIAEVGHDRKFCREYFIGMKAAGFKVVDQPQYFYKKSEGFRHIETAAKSGALYYLHSKAFEYCVENVAAIEKTDDMVQYEKVMQEQRIDIFDAAVFACIRMLENMDRASKAQKWFGEEKTDVEEETK